MFIKRSVKFFIIVLVAFAFASVATAYAASNTGITAQMAGDGAAKISGYSISNGAYTLDPSNPQNIAQVTFNLNSAAAKVKIKLVVATGSTWYDCSIDSLAPWSVTCNTTGATVGSADKLRIIATDR
jgi:hypothetical protein